jgi:outer membrane receptor for ferrienterochelin and colicins
MQKFCQFLQFFFTFQLLGQGTQDTLFTSLDQIVITSQFSPTSTRETVNSVKIIQRKTIEQKGVNNLQELLQSEPNIRLGNDGILGAQVSINGIRGENIKILVDGVPLVGRQNGNIDASQIPLYNIQQVEIVEGAQSVMYGSDAAGGVINLITKKSHINKYNAELATQLESNGFNNYNARLGIVKQKMTYSLSGNHLRFLPSNDPSMGRDQFWNPKRQMSVNGMARYGSDDGLSIRMAASMLTETIDNVGDIKRPMFKPYAVDDIYTNSRKDVQLSIDKKANNKWYYQGTLGWNSFERLKNTFRLDIEDQNKTYVEGLQDTSSAYGLLSRFTVARDDNTKKINFLIGIENFTEYAKDARIVDTLSKSGFASNNDLGFFGNGKYKIGDKLTLQSGARWTLNQRYGSAFTPAAWLHWKPNEEMVIKFSVASGFRSPALKELYFNFVDINHFVIGNDKLSPEKSLNVRSEFQFDLIKKNKHSLGFQSAAFYNKIENRITLSQIVAIQYQYLNINQWETKGASVRVNYNWNDKIIFQNEIVASWFYNSAFDTEKNLNKFNQGIDVVQDLTLNIFKEKMSVNVWHKLTGQSPIFTNIGGNVVQQSLNAWSMLNMTVGIKFLGDKLRLNFGAKNILDVTQIQTLANNGIHIENNAQQGLHWGRSFFVSTSVAIGKN